VPVIAVASAIGCSVLTDLDVLTNQRGTPVDAANVGSDASNEGASPIVEAGSANAGRSYRDIVMEDRPVAYWRLGEAPGELRARDETGNGNEGTFVGGVTRGAEGAIAGDPDTAIHLDGTGSVSIGDKLDFAGTVPFSLEAWIATNAAEPGIIGKKAYGLYFWGNGVRFDTYVDDTNRCPIIAFEGDGGALHDDQYHHIVATFDTVTMRIYVDGAVTRPFVCHQTLPDDSASLTLAAGLVGKIDEAAIYDHELPEQSVKKHFEARTTR